MLRPERIISGVITDKLLTLRVIDEHPEQKVLPHIQDQVLMKLFYVIISLDPMMFPNPFHIEAILSKINMSIKYK